MAEEKKKKDKHGSEEPDKMGENKECNEKEGEKVSV